jgi:ABC-type spermidine/putrescine transport system permease subunit II
MAASSIDSKMTSRHPTRLVETALPALGVAIGVLLIAGPFLATAIRSFIDWDARGAGLSLNNFAGLLTAPRFYQAAGNTLMCGAGATVMSCVLGFDPCHPVMHIGPQPRIRRNCLQSLFSNPP